MTSLSILTPRLLVILFSILLYACGGNDNDSSSQNYTSEAVPNSFTSSEAPESNAELNEGDIENEELDEVIIENERLDEGIIENEDVSPSATTDLFLDEGVGIESNITQDDSVWQAGDGWTNLSVAYRMQGIVNIQFDVRAKSDNINGVVAVTNGPAYDYSDLALIFRMFTDGSVDVRDGETYESDMDLFYVVDEIYHVEMNVDFNSLVYDVYITYPSGQRFPLRLSAAFRSSQPITSADQLVIYEANNNDLEVTNFKVNNNNVSLSYNSNTVSVGDNINENGGDTSNITNYNNTIMTELPPIIELNPDLPRIEVSNTSELSSALSATDAGGVIFVRSGTYGCIDLSNRAHSRSAPLIVEGINDDVVFSGNCSYVFDIANSSYIALRNISVEGGRDGVKVRGSNNIILDSINVSQSIQAGVYISENSSYVDLVNSDIYDTGQGSPQWGECVYIGTGDMSGYPDETRNVWVENNDIYNCGIGEAINVKTEVFNTTVRNNRVRNIVPGSFEYNKYNQAAITVEGGRGTDHANNHRPTEERNVWIESNTVSNVTEGRWNNGIMVGGTGVHVISNTLSNITDNAIWVNNWGNLGLPVNVSGNNVSSSGNDIDIGSSVSVFDLQIDNPNTAQNWLP